MFMMRFYFTHLAPHTLVLSSNIVGRHAHRKFLIWSELSIPLFILVLVLILVLMVVFLSRV
jgi:hypothetical protein